jgi:hypothetical protein
MIRSLLALTIFIGAPALVMATEEASKPAEAAVATVDANTTYLMCKNKADVRTVRVSKKNNGGCLTTYTKQGVDKIVNESWAPDRCEKVLNNIRTNLEKASWKCKDISDSRVSSSND